MTGSDDAVRGRHLHVDCASGAAGDMMLGALLDLGVPIDVVGDALDAIGAGRGRLHATRVVKHGISAIDLKVDTRGELAGAQRHVHPAAAPAPPAAVPPAAVPPAAVPPAAVPPAAVPPAAVPPAAVPPAAVPPAAVPPAAVPPAAVPPAAVPVRLARPRLHMHTHGAVHTGNVHRAPAGADHGHAHGAHVGADHGHAHDDHAHDDHAHGAHVGADHGHAHDDHAHDDHAHDAHVGADHGHAHDDHAQGDHAHYHYMAIRRRIADAELTAGTRRRALDIFDRIARAEAKLHGKTVEDVAFHEVGAIDSIVDIVGTAAALDWLAPRAVSCASVAMGHGTITCSHGVLPVPAPAALEVLREAGGVMADGGVARELCTPTGAAILAATVTSWTAAPTGRPVAVGWGAGDVELADRANVVRVVALDPGPAVDADRVWQIDANIDDMSPELCGPASDAVFAAGALDVWWTPITMKKGRPALMISALATDATRGAVAAAILRETTTIGVRYAARDRTVLARSIREVATAYGAIPVKVAADGETIMNAAPELDACVAAARRHGVPVKQVFAAAQAAFEATR